MKLALGGKLDISAFLPIKELLLKYPSFILGLPWAIIFLLD
jgi:hypothetical protein